MNINKDYVQGVVETTKDFFEIASGEIDSKKELNVTYEEITLGACKTPGGCRVKFNWKSFENEDREEGIEMNDKIEVFSNKGNLTSFISDIDSKLNDIHNLD